MLAGDARLVGVELISGAGTVEETERVAALRAEMKGLAAELGKVQDDIEALLAQRRYLRGALLDPVPGGTPRPGQSAPPANTAMADALRALMR